MKYLKKKRWPLKPLAPKDCRTTQQVISLRTDNFSTDEAWILVDPEREVVTLCNQRAGHSSTAMITMDRTDFNRLIGWYLRPQQRKRRADHSSAERSNDNA